MGIQSSLPDGDYSFANFSKPALHDLAVLLHMDSAMLPQSPAFFLRMQRGVTG
jgi:hypothetical protein